MRVLKSKKLAEEAGSLYLSGLAIDDVAGKLKVSYRTARKAIKANGVVIRDPSARLKGRTSPKGRKASK